MRSALVEVRCLGEHDLDAFARCVEDSFAVRFTQAKSDELVAGLDRDRALGAFDGLELVGTLAGYEAELTVPGPLCIPVLSLAEIAVLPTHRRRGVLTSLLRQAFDAGHARGDWLCVLASSEGGIYGRFGFGVATTYQRYALERSVASLVEPAGPAPQGRVVLLEPSEAAAALPLVFDVARRARTGELGRPPAYFEELVSTASDAGGPVRFFAFYEEAGTLDGYAVYDVGPSVGPDLAPGAAQRVATLEECCTTSDASYSALFTYLLGLDLTSGLRTGDRPVDEPLRYMLADPRALRTTGRGDGLWLRILDVPVALEARRYSSDGRSVIEVVDASCPWNAGRYAVEVARGAARVEATHAAADLTLDAGALATCYLGGGSVTGLRTAGRAVEHAAGAAARLDALLAWRPEPFCSTA
ncbi:MAG: GNAT family N-acetyltransferase [Acidimicrobiales bacterium]